MLNNFGFVFKTYFIIINDWMWKDKKLKKNKVLFKTIKKEKTLIVTEQKTNTNFVITKFYYFQLQEKGKKNFIK